MAFTNLAVFGGAFFTPIVVGKITHTLYWWWSFYLVAIFCAVCLPAVFFLCPETAYRRDANLNTDIIAADESVALRKTGSATGDAEKRAETEPPTASRGVDTPKVSWLQSLAPFNGRKSTRTSSSCSSGPSRSSCSLPSSGPP